MCPFSANSFVSLNNLSDIDEDLSCEALTSLKVFWTCNLV